MNVRYVWALLLLASCNAGPKLAPADAVFDPATLYPAAPAAVPDLLKKDSLTLDEYLYAVDRLNPAIAASRQKIDITAAEAYDAGLYPNPSISLALEDQRTRDAFDHSKRLVGVSQEFSVTSKYEAARNVKEKERERDMEEFRLLRRTVLLNAKQAFLDYLAAKARVELQQKIRDIVKNIHELTRTKFENRAAPEIQVLKSSVRLAIAEADVRQAEKQAQASLKALHVFMGNYDLSIANVTGSLATEYEDVSLEALRGAILIDHPRLESKRRQKEAAQLEVESAKADAWPNMRVGVQGGFDSEDASIIQAMLEVPLPVFNRNQGRIVAAELKIRQAELELENERNQILLELTQAHTNLQSAQERVKAYLEEVLPKARKGLEQAETGFRAGEFSLLDVLDSQTTLAESEAAALVAQEDLNRASTELEKLTGKRLKVIR